MLSIFCISPTLVVSVLARFATIRSASTKKTNFYYCFMPTLFFRNWKNPSVAIPKNGEKIAEKERKFLKIKGKNGRKKEKKGEKIEEKGRK